MPRQVKGVRELERKETVEGHFSCPFGLFHLGSIAQKAHLKGSEHSTASPSIRNKGQLLPDNLYQKKLQNQRYVILWDFKWWPQFFFFFNILHPSPPKKKIHEQPFTISDILIPNPNLGVKMIALHVSGISVSFCTSQFSSEK